MLVELDELCPSCVKKARRLKRSMIGVGIALCVGLLTVGVVRLVTHKKPIAYGKHLGEIRELRSYLEKEPCDRKKTVRLGELLLAAGDYRGALALCDGFAPRCGKYLRLKWISFSAHKHLSEFEEALKVVTELIEDDPYDKDFWWWRAEVYEEMEQYENAIHDYRQAIAVQPNITVIPFMLSDLLERAGRPCEAAFPIEQFLFYHPASKDLIRVQSRLRSIYSNAECADLYGKGEAVLRFDPNEGVIRVSAKFNDRVVGNLIFDTGATLVTISDRFAEGLQIDWAVGRLILVQTAGGMRTARLSTIDKIEVGGTVARRVQVAVLKAQDLGNRADGLLGMSYLSRFDTKVDNANGVVYIKTRNAPAVDAADATE